MNFILPQCDAKRQQFLEIQGQTRNVTESPQIPDELSTSRKFLPKWKPLAGSAENTYHCFFGGTLVCW
jgi:hypothetical protein